MTLTRAILAYIASCLVTVWLLPYTGPWVIAPHFVVCGAIGYFYADHSFKRKPLMSEQSERLMTEKDDTLTQED